jgi:inner membrane protein
LGLFEASYGLSGTGRKALSMLYKSHATIGAAAGAAAAAVTTDDLLIGVLVGGVAGLLPDVDHPGSTLGKLLPRWWHKLTPGHRGPTHTLWWCVLAGLAVQAMANWTSGGTAPGIWGVATVAGAFSHIVCDGLTSQGVPLLHPLSRAYVRLLGPFAFPAGSKREVVMATLLIAGLCFVTWQNLAPDLGGIPLDLDSLDFGR